MRLEIGHHVQNKTAFGLKVSKLGRQKTWAYNYQFVVVRNWVLGVEVGFKHRVGFDQVAVFDGPDPPEWICQQAHQHRMLQVINRGPGKKFIGSG